MDATPNPQFRFRDRDRLHGRRAFARVYDGRVRRRMGMLTVWAIPNDAGHWRLGLSVSRRVGTAVRRVRIKRMLREAFRLDRGTWPGGYDVVIVVAAHEPAALAAYRDLLTQAAGPLHREWVRRGGPGAPAAGGVGGQA